MTKSTYADIKLEYPFTRLTSSSLCFTCRKASFEREKRSGGVCQGEIRRIANVVERPPRLQISEYVAIAIAMLLARGWRPKFVRTSSTLVGRSGHVYVRDKLLQAHPKRSELNVFLAYCEDRPFVLKPVSQSIFELSQELRHEFGNSCHIRTHIDYNEEERVLVYNYLQGNLLSFVKNNPDLPIEARKFILRELGLGLKEIHAKNWIHLDLKPDNVMLNWSHDENGQFRIGQVVLSDLDCALKLKDAKPLDYRIGNVMWRSPEGQVGKGIGKSSEVFSFGLVCLYTITGVETLHPDFKQLKREGTEPEQVILYKLLSMFGPLPPELITHVDDEYWGELLTALSQVLADEDPSRLFEHWDEDSFPNLNPETKRLISRMTNLDPKKRATMDQILEDPWWK